MINLTIKVLIFNSLLLMSIVGYAGELPSYYPKSFVKTGVIDELSISNQRIIIDDELFQVDSSLLVHSLNNQSVSTASSLALGMNVGTTIINNGKVFELWILPSSYDEDANDE